MSVTNLHPLYSKRFRQWKVIRDCVEGEDTIKDAGIEYLPKASGTTDKQYEAYKRRARWNNYLAQNLDGLHGLIFRRNPVVTEKDDELRKSGILDNIDRRGTNLYQFLSDSVYDIMQTSFGGFLVDMPKADGPMTQDVAEKLGIRPYLRYYPAESIINWGYRVIDGVEQLAYVVLQEEIENSAIDEFAHKPLTQYRVLDCRSGVYIQRVFTQDIIEDEKESEGKEPTFTESVNQIIVNGKQLNYIPFIMAPSRLPEKPMFYDLAKCNIGHYMKSADYENGVHLTTIPTGYVTGHRQEVDPDTGEKEIIHLGGDSFLMFPEEQAKVGTLVFSGAGLTHSETALNQSLADMAIIGSRLLASEKGVSESADSAKIHRAGENARLATFAKNVSEKITQVIRIMAEWMNVDTKLTVELCTDYDTLAFDPNALNALANLSESGRLPLPALFWNLKNGEYLPQGMSFDTFATMLDLDKLGYSPIDQARIYKALMNGDDVEIKEQETPFNSTPENTSDKNNTEKDD